jgi:hypothetical protein
MNNITSSLCVDYIFLDPEERKRFSEPGSNYIIKIIRPNDCYRVYRNFVILFVEENVGNIKYSTFKNFNSK